MSLNVDFLRSGRAFVRDQAPNQLLLSHDSVNERLNKFYTQTLSAVESAVGDETVSSDFKVARNAPSSVVNLDFLRSGGEFVETSTMKAEETRGQSSANERLNAYYNRTIAAVEQAVENELVSRDFKVASNAPSTILNINFLKSGGEFVSNNRCDLVDRPASAARASPKTTSQRLNDFYRATLSAVETSIDFVSRDFKVVQEPPTTVVNLDFLRSGGEFKDSLTMPATERVRSHSMNERLNKFYDSTLAAVQTALQTDQVSRDFKVVHAMPAIVNLPFLRSGAEFTSGAVPAANPTPATGGKGQMPSAAAATPAPPAASRLERFHAQTAAAAMMAAQAGVVPRS